MTEPTTPPEERRHGLNRSRWIAAGAAAGAAVVLTGTIAVVHAAPSSPSDSSRLVRTDDGIGDDEYVPAEPFQPQTQSPSQQPQTETQQTPQFSPQSGSARTNSGGS
jgi:hypothetical protein